MMLILLCAAGWGSAAATPMKLLTVEDARAIHYTWSDGSSVYSSDLSQTATTPAQIYSLLRHVYMDKRVPGPYTAAYEGPSTTYDAAYYTQDASVVNPNGSASYFLNESATRTPSRDVYYGAIGQGWNITTTDNKPTDEGYTVLLVAVKDSYQSYATDNYYPSGSYLSDSASVVTFLDRMVDSVMVITNSVRVNEGTREAGAVFNCSSYLNRFFFLSKGQARDISYGQNLYSTWYSKATRGSSYPSTSYFGNQSPFAEMFEQFSPNNGYVDTDASFSDITDIYSQLTAGATYNIRHDCPSALMQHHDFSVAGSASTEHKPLGGLNLFVPDYRLESWFQTVDWVWASISSSGTVSTTTTQVDARSMYDDATFCQNGSSYATDYNNPYWTYDDHTGLYITYDYQYLGSSYPNNRSSALYHFYNPHHFPKMNLYSIQLTADTTGVKRVEDGTTYYQIRVSWTSSLSKLVGDGIVEYFHLYTIGTDGTYNTLIERNSDEFNTADYTTEGDAYCYYYYVPQEEYSQYFTYIVSGQPINNGNIYFTPTWSNEDDVFIPGWSTNESLRLVLVDNISQYTTSGEFNHYNNKLKVVQGATPWLANDLQEGDNLLHFVRIDDQGEETEFATLNYYRGGSAIFVSTNDLKFEGTSSKTFKVNTSGVTGTVTLTASSGFTVSPSSFTANGSERTITVTRTSGTTGTITLTASGVSSQVVNLTYSSTVSPYTTMDYSNMEGTSLSASTDEKGGTWTYTGTGSYAYGLTGPISNVNYMYFTSDGSATYTFPAGLNLDKAIVAITVQSGSYGTGYLYVNGSSIRYNGSTVTNTFSNVDVSSGTITITSPNGSSGSSSYSLRIRSITIYLVGDDVEYPTTGAVVIKPAVNYVFDNAANNTTLNYTARPFAVGDQSWLESAIDYVNDVFSVSTADNSHSAYYNYYVTMADSVYTGPVIIRPTAGITMTDATQTIQVKGDKLTTGATITTTGDFSVSPSTLTRDQALAGTPVVITYTGNAAPGTTVNGTLTVTSGTATSTVTITYVVPDVPVLTTSTQSVTFAAPAQSASFTVSGSNLTSDVYLTVTDGIGVTPAFISAQDAMNGNYTLTVVPLDPRYSVSGTVTVTSEGAESKTVYVNYTASDAPVVATPTLSVSPASVAIDGNEGTTGTFTVTGSNLTGSINFASSNSDFTVQNNNGTVTVTYNGDAGTDASTVITVSSDGAQSQTVEVTYTAPAGGGETGGYPYTLDFSGQTAGYTTLTLEEPWSASYVYPRNGAMYISYSGNLKFTVPAAGNVTITITTASSNGKGYIKVGTSTQETKATANGGTYTWTFSNLSAGDVITINGANARGSNNDSPNIVSIVASAQ